MIAVAHGARRKRCKIGARPRFGKTLAPPVIKIGRAWQKALLLRLGPKMCDHRPHHVAVEGKGLRHAVLLQFLDEDILLDRAPGLAAPFERPARHGPAALIQNPLRGDDVVLLKFMAFLGFPADLLRDLGLTKPPYLLPEGLFLRGKTQVHLRFLDLGPRAGERLCLVACKAAAGMREFAEKARGFQTFVSGRGRKFLKTGLY